MSNIELSVSQEELFSELTAEQAAVIEGGKKVILHDILAIKTGADLIGEDDLYIKVKGNKVFSRDMTAGEFALINKSVTFSGSAFISLFDADPGPFNDDDYIDGFTASNSTNGSRYRTLKGSGSEYKLHYSVTA